jgi:hypothetical protein
MTISPDSSDQYSALGNLSNLHCREFSAEQPRKRFKVRCAVRPSRALKICKNSLVQRTAISKAWWHNRC